MRVSTQGARRQAGQRNIHEYDRLHDCGPRSISCNKEEPHKEVLDSWSTLSRRATCETSLPAEHPREYLMWHMQELVKHKERHCEGLYCESTSSRLPNCQTG